MNKIIVAGAGAAGMMAAGQAALMGGNVLLLEKMRQPGNKLRISGKGRCNLTNMSEISEFIQHFNRAGRFLHQPFSRFFAPELVDFFNELGVKLVTERGRRVFPASGKATEVIEALLLWLQSRGVQLRCSTPVTGLVIENKSIKGVLTPEGQISCSAVILSAGGASYPGTGSAGEGFTLAERAGHTIIPLRPALAPLTVTDSSLHSLTGLDLKNVGIRIYLDGKRKINDFGEMSFIPGGIGGPVILTHSLLVVDCLRAGKSVQIAIDLKPALDEKKLDGRLQRDFQTRRNEPATSVLRGLLPQKLVDRALRSANIDGNKAGGEITSRERLRLRTWLKDFRLTVNGHRPLKEAIVTAGGVKVAEINPNTMESRKISGLYITGETLDINGETGGYNLQAAFSTGWLAGRSAAAAPSASLPPP